MPTKTKLKWNVERPVLCAKCGGPIFFLEYPDCQRRWWHESPRLDFRHRPEPEDDKNNASRGIDII